MIAWLGKWVPSFWKEHTATYGFYLKAFEVHELMFGTAYFPSDVATCTKDKNSRLISFPLQVWTGPWGSRRLRLQEGFMVLISVMG
jgi:hypothetical protein